MIAKMYVRGSPRETRTMIRKFPHAIHVLAALAATAALSVPAFAAEGGHGQGRGSFSTGNHGGGASSHNGGGRSYGGQQGNYSRGGGSGGGGNRSYSAPRSSPNYSAPRSSGNFRTERSVGAERNFRNESPSFRANPRAGFQTTRPDYGVNRSARPGFSTRPDMNGRPGFDNRYSFNGSRNNDRPASTYRPGGNARPGYNRGFDNGFRGGVGYSHRPYWRGGYWNGRFWPRVYYRPHYVSFYPTLPYYYSTFWWGGLSYYYVDDLYYTWNQDRYGYVLTNPPPAASSEPAQDDQADGQGGSGTASVYVYPRNGQSEEQTSNDRYECHQWAVNQTGFDPTTATGDTQTAGQANPEDYRRALMACLDARGYSAN